MSETFVRTTVRNETEENPKIMHSRDGAVVDDFFANMPLGSLAQIASAGTTQANYEAAINAGVYRAMAANKNFILTGTGLVAAGSADPLAALEEECIVAAADGKGGITLSTRTTGTANNDATNIRPGTMGAINASTLAVMTSVPEAQPFVDAVIQTPATITGLCFYVGFRLLAGFPDTDVSAVETTGNELAMIGLNTGSGVSATQLRCIARAAGASLLDRVATWRGVQALPAVAASTRYRLRVEFDSSRRANFYVGIGTGEVLPVGQSRPITAAAALVPFITVGRVATALKSLTVRRLRFGRLNS